MTAIAIAIDGLDEEDFRRSIETMLRRGDADGAAKRLRSLMAPYVGVGRILPPRFLSASAKDMTIEGWDGLGERLAQHDRPGHPITALSIAFTHPPDDAPESARTAPFIETGYYSDDSYPFSQSAREDLLEGYSYFGCDWSGDCEASDAALSITGIDDLHSALGRLEARLLGSDVADVDGIRAGSLGACYVSVLLFQALRDTISRHMLPRPLCIMSGCNGVYPYFDAPVAGIDAGAKEAASGSEDQAGDDAPGSSRYASLLMSSIPRARKRAVLVLAETPEETAQRVANLRGLPQTPDESGEADAKKLSKRLALHFPSEGENAEAGEMVASGLADAPDALVEADETAISIQGTADAVDIEEPAASPDLAESPAEVSDAAVVPPEPVYRHPARVKAAEAKAAAPPSRLAALVSRLRQLLGRHSV